MFEVRHYLRADGRDPFADWLKKLRDPKGKIAVIRRVNRMELGNFGDHKTLRDGVSELRIDTGPGYRIDYAITDRTIVLLLCGGNKGSQDADIERACALWQDWQARSPDGEDEP